MPGGTVKYSIVADAKPFVDATQQASKELGKLTDQAVGSAGSLGSIAAAAGPMGKALAVATGAGVAGFTALAAAVASAVKGLVETGGHLADISAQTGISTQALQKLAYAGSLVGVSQEQITAAAVKMEKAIANGDDVFKRLGLSVQNLKAMQPDQAFAAVAAQIARIKDPANQAAAAMEVFGKAGATMLPLIKSDLKAAGEEAERLGIILSDKTVNAADALGDEATKLGAAWEGVKNQFAAAIIQNPALLNAFHSLVEVLGDLAHWFIANRGAIAAVVDILIGTGQSAVTGFKQLWEWAGKAADKLKYLIDLVPGLRSTLKVAQDIGTYLGMKNVEGSGLSSSSRVVLPGVDFSAKGSAASAASAQAAAAAAAKAWTDSAEKSRKAEDAFTASVKDNAYQQMLGIQNLFDKRTKITTDGLNRELKAQQDFSDKMEKIGQDNAAVWAQMYKQAGAQVGAIFDDVAQKIGGAWGEMFHSLGTLAARFVSENKAGMGDWVASHQKAIQAVVAGIQTVYSAYQGGVQSKSPTKGALAGAGKGAATGAAVGALFGGVGAVPGAIIGGVVGGIAGFLGGKKGQAAEIAGLKQQFDALSDAAQKAGVVLGRAFDPRNAQQYRQAIDEIQHALDIQGESQQALNDAVQRYGFTLDELGPVMQRQELDKQAGQLYQDWQLLNQAGIDHNAIIERMGPSINEYVQNAIAAGGEIPAAFKPIIDDLISQGALLDANGNAYTSAEAAGITYAQTMSQMFQDLIKHVEELVAAIRGVPDKTATITVRTVREGGGGGEDTSGGDDSDGGRVRGYASGGVFAPRAGGHVIRIAEGGQPEAVLNPGQMAAMAGGSPEALEQLRQMNQTLRGLAGAIATSTRDAVMLSR